MSSATTSKSTTMRKRRKIRKTLVPDAVAVFSKVDTLPDYFNRHMKSHSHGGGIGMNVSDPDDVKHVLHGADTTLDQLVTMASSLLQMMI